MDENEERIAQGAKFAEFVWWSLAKRIVLLAGEFYKWNDDEWQIANDIFLRSNDYSVVPR